MSGNASDAKDARVAQMLFGDCIRAIIDGKDAEVKSKIDSYLANNRIDIDDIFRFNAQGILFHGYPIVHHHYYVCA
jgi:hypothetical protein